MSKGTVVAGVLKPTGPRFPTKAVKETEPRRLVGSISVAHPPRASYPVAGLNHAI